MHDNVCVHIRRGGALLLQKGKKKHERIFSSDKKSPSPLLLYLSCFLFRYRFEKMCNQRGAPSPDWQFRAYRTREEEVSG